MTAEELFDDLINKYGLDFNWRMISFSNHSYAEELNKELGEDGFTMPIYSVAKCESNNDLLVLIDENDYRIYHLTYSNKRPDSLMFDGLQSAVDYIEQEYLEHFKNRYLFCPVCGKRRFGQPCDNDICKYCGWENDDNFEGGGANELSLKDYKSRYRKYIEMNPNYIWKKDGFPDISSGEK